jgi:hypothetical protein
MAAAENTGFLWITGELLPSESCNDDTGLL